MIPSVIQTLLEQLSVQFRNFNYSFENSSRLFAFYNLKVSIIFYFPHQTLETANGGVL